MAKKEMKKIKICDECSKALIEELARDIHKSILESDVSTKVGGTDLEVTIETLRIVKDFYEDKLKVAKIEDRKVGK